MRCFVKFEFELTDVNREQAENIRDELMGELAQCDNVVMDTFKHDLVIVGEGETKFYPTKGGGNDEYYDSLESETAQQVQMVPDNMGVTHPWDQGLYIFPPDHPLRPYEELARDGLDEEHPDVYRQEKQAFLEVGTRLMLPPPPSE